MPTRPNVSALPTYQECVRHDPVSLRPPANSCETGLSVTGFFADLVQMFKLSAQDPGHNRQQHEQHYNRYWATWMAKTPAARHIRQYTVG